MGRTPMCLTKLSERAWGVVQTKCTPSCGNFVNTTLYCNLAALCGTKYAAIEAVNSENDQDESSVTTRWNIFLIYFSGHD